MDINVTFIGANGHGVGHGGVGGDTLVDGEPAGLVLCDYLHYVLLQEVLSVVVFEFLQYISLMYVSLNKH